MNSWKRFGLVLTVGAAMAAGCGVPQGPAASRGGGPDIPAADSSRAPKRITAAMMGNPPTPFEKIIGGGSGGRIPGITGLEQLVGAGLTVKDDKRVLRPQLAEAAPSIENGLWKVLPDGHMETTWKIRPGARWHDGVAVTSDDMVFSSVVEQDRELPVERNVAHGVIEEFLAPDPQTITVRWKRPYIEADDLFSRPWLPRHLLERPYLESKETFTALPYWNTEFVGTGPYKVQDWVRDSHVVLQANDQYVLGRPKIDEIEVRFLADENAFMANILAGGVDVTLGKSITLEQTSQVRDQWKNGRVEIVPETAMKIWPQFVNPNPAIVAEVQFRKALMHAVDRQEMVDTIMGGMSSIAHTLILPNEPELADLEASLVKYEYDPRRAIRIIEGLAYARAPEGFLRPDAPGGDGTGQRLSVQISATNEDQNTKPMFAVSDYWQRIGVGVETVVIPIQRQRDREYRATFPAFTLQGGASGVVAVKNSRGSQARLPENNYTGSNYSRYMNPEFDALIDRFLSTIPRQERIEALRQVVGHMTDHLTMMNLYYATSSTMIAHRMVDAGRDPTWNAHEWDVKQR